MTIKLAFVALLLAVVVAGFSGYVQGRNDAGTAKPTVCTTAITEDDVPIRINGEWYDFIPRCK